MLRAAIVGLGWWGKTLVSAVQGKSDAVKFVVGATRSRAKAEEFCRDHGIKLVDDYDQVLADPAVEAVVLATPHSQHGEQVRRAAAARKHVFCEKPFTLTAADARSAIEAAEKAGIVLAVGFNRRFHPSMAELKRRVQDGALGVIETCISEHTAGAGLSIQPGYWRADPSETPAGAMTGIGIHTVDTMIHLFGRISEVHCITARRAAPHVDDTTTVLVKFTDGMSGIFFGSLTTVPNYRFAVYGSKGFAEIAKPNLDEFRFAPTPDPKLGHLASVQPEVTAKPGFDTLAAELAAFPAAIGSKTPYPVPLHEVLHGVEVFEAIVNSAKAGKPMKVG
ncbi:MAG: Gfo/Idh/MocA family protein [Xanthobacteraceae bacterium]